MGVACNSLGLLVGIALLVVVEGCGKNKPAGDTSNSDEPSDSLDTSMDEPEVDIPIDTSPGDQDVAPDDPAPDSPVDSTFDDPESVGDAMPWDSGVTPGDACFTPIDAGFDPVLDAFELSAPGRDPTPCEGCCRQVTFWDGNEVLDNVDVWGRFMVYRATSRIAPYLYSQIRLVDLQTYQEYILERGTYNSPENMGYSLQFPSIYESNVIYLRYLGAGTSLPLTYDVILVPLIGEGSTIVHSGTVVDGGWGPHDIHMYGDNAVWDENRTPLPAGQELYLLHISTGELQKISLGMCCVGSQAIWGTKVVYSDVGMDILMYDIETGETIHVTDDLYDQWDCEIWDNIVAWVDTRNGGNEGTRTNADIYMYDIVTGETRQVTTNPFTQMGELDVYEDMIVWRDLRDDPEHPDDWMAARNLNIYGYLIPFSTEYSMTRYDGAEGYPRLYGDKFFYGALDTYGFFSMFMFQL